VSLITIGYAGWEPTDIKALVDRESAILVDVRLKPFAKREEFCQRPLTRLFGSAYVHARGLGNLNYKGEMGPGVKLADPQPWVEQIRQWLSGERTVILMCGCYNHTKCHRSDVAKLICTTCRHEYPPKKGPTHRPDHDAGAKRFGLPPGYGQESFL
jgi:hypothetical protein